MRQDVARNFEEAKKLYGQHGINVDEILTELERIKISIHCWQGDDVRGFLFRDQELSGAYP